MCVCVWDLCFDKKPKTIKWRKDSLSTNALGSMHIHMKKKEPKQTKQTNLHKDLTQTINPDGSYHTVSTYETMEHLK